MWFSHYFILTLCAFAYGSIDSQNSKKIVCTESDNIKGILAAHSNFFESDSLIPCIKAMYAPFYELEAEVIMSLPAKIWNELSRKQLSSITYWSEFPKLVSLPHMEKFCSYFKSIKEFTAEQKKQISDSCLKIIYNEAPFKQVNVLILKQIDGQIKILLSSENKSLPKGTFDPRFFESLADVAFEEAKKFLPSLTFDKIREDFRSQAADGEVYFTVHINDDKFEKSELLDLNLFLAAEEHSKIRLILNERMLRLPSAGSFDLDKQFPNHFASMTSENISKLIKEILLSSYSAPLKILGQSQAELSVIADIVKHYKEKDSELQVYISGKIIYEVLGYLYQTLHSIRATQDKLSMPARTPFYEIGIGSEINIHLVSKTGLVDDVKLIPKDNDVAWASSMKSEVLLAYPKISISFTAPKHDYVSFQSDDCSSCLWASILKSGEFEYEGGSTIEEQENIFLSKLHLISQLPFCKIAQKSISNLQKSLENLDIKSSDVRLFQLIRNSKFGLGNNRIYRNKAENSFDVMVFNWMHKLKHFVVPEVMKVNSTWLEEDRIPVEDSCVHSRRLAQDTLPAMFHGTKFLANVPGMIQSGVVLSKRPYLEDFYQGMANYGSGFYIAGRIDDALNYSGNGLTLRYRWNESSNYKMIDFDLCPNFRHLTIERNMRTYDVDMVIGCLQLGHFVLQSLKNVDMPSSLSLFAQKALEDFKKMDSFDENFIRQYCQHYNLSKFYGLDVFPSPFKFFSTKYAISDVVSFYIRWVKVLDHAFLDYVFSHVFERKISLELWKEVFDSVLVTFDTIQVLLRSFESFNAIQKDVARKMLETCISRAEKYSGDLNEEIKMAAVLMEFEGCQSVREIGIQVASKIFKSARLICSGGGLKVDWISSELWELLINFLSNNEVSESSKEESISNSKNWPLDHFPLVSLSKLKNIKGLPTHLQILPLVFYLKKQHVLEGLSSSFDFDDDKFIAFFISSMAADLATTLIEQKIYIRLTPKLAQAVNESKNLVLLKYFVSAFLDGQLSLSDLKSLEVDSAICDELRLMHVTNEKYGKMFELVKILPFCQLNHIASRWRCSSEKILVHFPFQDTQLLALLKSQNFDFSVFFQMILPKKITVELTEKILNNELSRPTFLKILQKRINQFDHLFAFLLKNLDSTVLIEKEIFEAIQASQVNQ